MFAQGKVTLNPSIIQNWANARHGWPVVIREFTPSGTDLALSFMFPDSETGQVIRRLSWEEFFEQFDRLKLVFVYQDGDGELGLNRSYAFM